MPQIINPFRVQNTPLAQAITQVGNDIYGDQLTPALNREKLIAAQRENVETGNLASSFAAGSPDYEALIASGYKPSDFGDAMLVRNANTYGGRDQRTQDAMIGAGKPFSATAEAFDTGIATERRGQDIASADRRYGFNLNDSTERWKFSNTPEEVFVDGVARFMPREKVYAENVEPVLSETEKGRNRLFNEAMALYGEVYPESTPEQRKQYALQQVSKSQGQRTIYDPKTGSLTIEEGGMGPLTNSNTTNSQGAQIAAAKYRSAAKRAIELTRQDPTLFGAVGKGRKVVAGITGLLDNIALVAGKSSIDELKRDIAQQVTKEGTPVASLIPELYDPNLSKVETLWGYLYYADASALAGQDGRSVSDKDFEAARTRVGNPHGAMENADTLRAKLEAALEILGDNTAIDQNALEGKPLDPQTNGAATGKKRIRFNPATGDFEE